MFRDQELIMIVPAALYVLLLRGGGGWSGWPR